MSVVERAVLKVVALVMKLVAEWVAATVDGRAGWKEFS